MRLFFGLGLSLALAAAAAQGKDGPVVVSVNPDAGKASPDVVRGGEVRLTLKQALPPNTAGYLWLKPIDPIPAVKPRKDPADPFPPVPVTAVPAAPPVPGPPDPAKDAKPVVVGLIPATQPLGRYLVGVTLDPTAEPAYTTTVRVVRPPEAKPELTAVHPTTGYPAAGSFVLIGDNFSEVAEDNVLVFEGRGEVRLTPGEPPETGKTPALEAGVKYEGPRKLVVFGTLFREHVRGRVKLRVRVGDDVSKSSADVTFAHVNAHVPAVAAAAFTLAFAGVVYWLIARKIGTVTIAGWQYGPLSTLILDKETDTYSLSKFQLLVWTAAAVFGYVYLTVTRNLIQGLVEFPPVPENLPGLLVVSLTTTATAAGITNARGPKGAGDVHPSRADLIAVGGVVSPERLQFFIWTVLGVAALLFLIFRTDPAQMTDLPKIPENFLYVMGVSSAGYLGGKLARRAGPVIDTIDAREGSLILEVRGRRLSRNASFELNGADVTWRPAGPDVPAEGTPPRLADATLEILHKDDDAQDAEYASAIRLTLADPAAWAERHKDKIKLADLFPATKPAPAGGSPPPAAGGHVTALTVPPTIPPVKPLTDDQKPRLTVINPDGQRATWMFDVQRKPTS